MTIIERVDHLSDYLKGEIAGIEIAIGVVKDMRAAYAGTHGAKEVIPIDSVLERTIDAIEHRKPKL